LSVDTSIDEFFDEHLQRVLGASPEAAEKESWYPASSDAAAGATDEVPDLPGDHQGTALAGTRTGR